VGFEDARMLAEQLNPLSPHALTELDPHRAWVRSLRGGTMLEPAFVSLDPPYTPRTGRAAIVVQESRRKFATRRDVVERNIATWLAH
jgi:hypothetical protein